MQIIDTSQHANHNRVCLQTYTSPRGFGRLSVSVRVSAHYFLEVCLWICTDRDGWSGPWYVLQWSCDLDHRGQAAIMLHSYLCLTKWFTFFCYSKYVLHELLMSCDVQLNNDVWKNVHLLVRWCLPGLSVSFVNYIRYWKNAKKTGVFLSWYREIWKV